MCHKGLSVDIHILLTSLISWYYALCPLVCNICMVFYLPCCFIKNLYWFNDIWSISFHFGGSLRVLQAQILNLIIARMVHDIWMESNDTEYSPASTAFAVSLYIILLQSCFSSGFHVFIWLYPSNLMLLWVFMNTLLQ